LLILGINYLQNQILAEVYRRTVVPTYLTIPFCLAIVLKIRLINLLISASFFFTQTRVLSAKNQDFTINKNIGMFIQDQLLVH
jgi:hypothetical protein